MRFAAIIRLIDVSDGPLEGENQLNFICHTVVSSEILIAWLAIWVARSSLRETTLVSAWVWSVVVLAAWTFSWFVDSIYSAISVQLADHLWYASAVVALCPPISVLGSRSPGSRVWNSFIMLPMLLTLGWPVIALAFQGSELRGLHLETPQLVAFSLVLIMGVGNYFGTRYTIPAILYGGSILALVVSMTMVSPQWLLDRSVTRFWCVAIISLAVCLAWKSTNISTRNRFDRVWFDFFDTFGIVWGRRIQDRVNFIAKKEGLPVQLELNGFVWDHSQIRGTESENRKSKPNHDDPAPALRDISEVESRMEHILRWLLRRFVEPPWIDQRLGTTAKSEIAGMNVDS